MRSTLTSLVVAVLLVGSLATRSEAESTAAELRAQGEALGKQGEFAAAIERFKLAEASEPLASNDCFVAISYARLKKWTQAKLFLERCRSRTGGIPKLKWYPQAEKLINRTLSKREFSSIVMKSQPEGGSVHLVGTPEDEVFELPLFLWLPKGVHEVEVTKSGFVDQAVNVESARGGKAELLVELEAVAIEPIPPVTPIVPVKTESHDSAAIESPPSVRKDSSAWAWVTVGAGGLSLAGGIVAHVAASRSRDRALDPSYDYDAEIETFKTRRLMTIGMYSLAGVLGGIGTYLLFDSDREKMSPALTVQISPFSDGAVVSAGGSY